MPAFQALFHRLGRNEPMLFLALLLAHVSVLFRYSWYPTLDGPAHLYNAHLIKQLLLGAEHPARFFAFSGFPEPNWSGHAIMALLSLFLPTNWVEKGLVLLIFTGTAFGFRALVRALHPSAGLATLLVFPFLCTHTFRMGFFNFSLSIAVGLWTLWWWQRMKERPGVRGTGVLFLLSGLLYFSNALTALVILGALGLWIAWEQLLQPTPRPLLARRLRSLLLAALPWLVLILLFVLRGQEGKAGTSHLPAMKLWTMVREGVPFSLQPGASMIWSARIIAVSLLLFMGGLLAYRLGRQSRPQVNDLWLLMALLAGIGYVILPDKAATGGIISVRYLLFLYLFLALWSACQRWPGGLHLLLVPFLLADLWLVRADHHFTGELDAEVVELRMLLPHIPDNATVLPLLYSDYWMHSNLSNYLGTERGIVVVDNYEAMSPHFPLRWRSEHRPPEMEQGFLNSNRPCIDVEQLGAAMGMRFDHVLRWHHHSGITDSCSIQVDAQLGELFRRAAVSAHGRAELFER
jgi:hypothetical protein